MIILCETPTRIMCSSLSPPVAVSTFLLTTTLTYERFKHRDRKSEISSRRGSAPIFTARLKMKSPTFHAWMTCFQLVICKFQPKESLSIIVSRTIRFLIRLPARSLELPDLPSMLNPAYLIPGAFDGEDPTSTPMAKPESRRTSEL